MKIFRATSPATLLFIAGEGGHLEQARRILASLDADVRSASLCVLITDTATIDAGDFDECWGLDSSTPKHRATTIKDLLTYAVSSGRTFWRMARHHDIRMAVVTGPGFSMLPALGAKLLGAHLVVFETWSRFEHRSKCGKVLYRFADDFFVQHEELLKLYPKAKWVGLL